MTAPLRVLTLTTRLAPGGTSGRILGMAQGLDRERIDHRVAVIYDPQPESIAYFGTTMPLFERAGIPVRTLGLKHPSPGTLLPAPKRAAHYAGALRSAVSELASVVRREKIDVIDAHLAPSTLVAGIVGKMTRTPAIVTDYHIGEPAPLMFWPVVGRLALDLATAVVTDSLPRAADLKRWMYRRYEKVHVIPNGIVPPQSELMRAQARARFGITENDVAIVQISTLQPHKGHRVLLDAARIVVDRVPNARFLLVGFARGSDGVYRDELLEQAQRLGLTERVFIGPYHGPVGDVWQAADLQVHASLFDSLPNAIIEGMSLGKPAAVTSVGGIPDLVTHDQTGLVVPPGDAQALAGALVQLLGDPEKAARLGAAAKERYSKEYRADITSAKLEALFAQTVAKQ